MGVVGAVDVNNTSRRCTEGSCANARSMKSSHGRHRSSRLRSRVVAWSSTDHSGWNTTQSRVMTYAALAVTGHCGSHRRCFDDDGVDPNYGDRPTYSVWIGVGQGVSGDPDRRQQAIVMTVKDLLPGLRTVASTSPSVGLGEPRWRGTGRQPPTGRAGWWSPTPNHRVRTDRLSGRALHVRDTGGAGDHRHNRVREELATIPAGPNPAAGQIADTAGITRSGTWDRNLISSGVGGDAGVAANGGSDDHRRGAVPVLAEGARNLPKPREPHPPHTPRHYTPAKPKV